LIIDCIFSNNLGGGVNLNTLSVVILNSNFTNNIRVSAFSMPGLPASLNMSGCNFNNNSAVGGSAVYLNSVINCSISQSTFFNNFGVNSSGGAIYMYQGNKMKIDDCIFENNAATVGGAIAILYCVNVEIDNVTIINNRVGSTGGGVYCLSSNVTILNSCVQNNSASFGQNYFCGQGCINSQCNNEKSTCNNFVTSSSLVIQSKTKIKPDAVKTTVIIGATVGTTLGIAAISLLVIYVLRFNRLRKRKNIAENKPTPFTQHHDKRVSVEHIIN